MNEHSFKFQQFPSVEEATSDGVIAVGGKLSVDFLISAYLQGIFPWPVDKNSPLLWFSPDPRGIIEFSDIHIPARLKRKIKQKKFIIKYNTNFEAVIRKCSKVTRKDQSDTWITDDLLKAYIELFNKGFAYSAEAYKEEKLVGGLYGVRFGNFVSGESMFYTETDASKIALLALIEKLRSQKITWMDTQMITPVVASLGGKEISRNDFMKKIKESIIDGKWVF